MTATCSYCGFRREKCDDINCPYDLEGGTMKTNSEKLIVTARPDLVARETQGQVDALRQQRDDLLAALEALYDPQTGPCRAVKSGMFGVHDRARAAIARARGTV